MTRLHPIFSLVLATLVMISSTRFMVGMHFCMGEIQSIALFTKAESCEKEKSLPLCHRHEAVPCCDDKAFTHEAQDVNATTFNKVELAPVQFVLVHLPSILISEIIPLAPAAQTHYYAYDPPVRACDRVVTLQSFLI